MQKLEISRNWQPDGFCAKITMIDEHGFHLGEQNLFSGFSTFLSDVDSSKKGRRDEKMVIFSGPVCVVRKTGKGTLVLFIPIIERQRSRNR